MSDALVLVRAVHLLATILLAGGVFFRAFVAEPALGDAAALRARFRSRLRWVLAVSLCTAVVSGAAWFALLVARIGEASFAEFSERAAIFLTQTQFGITWLLRLALALVLAAVLCRRSDWHESAALRTIVLIASAAFAGLLTWSGHGGATPGSAGALHSAADALHLVAAAAWLGGLVPLVLLLRWAMQTDQVGAALPGLLRRFSNLGAIAVASLVASGAVNTIFSIGSIEALFESDYGRLLLLKIALFAGMAAFAAINRLTWTPRLAAMSDAAKPARMIYANALAEIALGIAVVIIVGWLGILAPDMPPQGHFH